MLTCPNCGYKQADGKKCQKCSSLFSYYSEAERKPFLNDEKAGVPEKPPRAPGLFAFLRLAYRISSWSSLALLVVTLLLIFHKRTAPLVPVDSQAAARAAAKLSQAQAAAEQNRPAQVTLDRTELNSYLNSNLELPNSAPKPDAAATIDAPNPIPVPSSDVASGERSVAEVQSAVKDVKVDIVDDVVKAYVVFDFHGKDMSLELDGHLSSADGYLHFEPTAGSLGSLPLPQSTLDAAVARLMSSPENREKLKLPPGINNIKIENGQVVIDYQ